jgi:hypothetical protein
MHFRSDALAFIDIFISIEENPLESCKLTDDISRDCCMNAPLKICRISAIVSLTLLMASMSASMFLFCRRHTVGKESFNLFLHMLINLTFLSRAIIYLDNTLFQFNWTAYLVVKYLPNIFSS